ncbi:MAG: glycosyltransferase [Bacteroidia bacterium]|nr:glycosyltransferase [Bacteroidia bacterium]
MPKVLRIINRFNLGGITYNVSYLSKYLPQQYETLLIGGPEEEGEESSLYIPESLGLKPIIVHELKRSINPLSDYYAYKKIKQIIKEFKPDIVHTHASKAGAIGRLAAFSCNVPVVVHTFHGHVFKGYFSSFKTFIFKTIERYLSKRSSAIVAISGIQKTELTKDYNVCAPEKTHVIKLGFDLKRFAADKTAKRELFRKNFYVLPEELTIGIIGRLAPIKNHFLFIDAIAHVAKNSDKKINAFIIGDGETKEELIKYTESKGLTWSEKAEYRQQITFTSWIKEIDIALAGLDIVCLTSKNEGTPVSLIEAQAAGKFIVTTNVGGVKDILNPKCGLLSEADDRETYKKNLLEAVTNFSEISKNAHTASEEVINEFSYSRLCREMDELYRKLLKV